MVGCQGGVVHLWEGVREVDWLTGVDLALLNMVHLKIGCKCCSAPLAQKRRACLPLEGKKNILLHYQLVKIITHLGLGWLSH